MHIITRFCHCYFSPDGRVTIETQAPDTITSWIASAFAVSTERGLGIAGDTDKVGSQMKRANLSVQ